MLASSPLRNNVVASPIPTIQTKPQRPIPLQRRSTLKRSIDDTNMIQVPASPAKRSRVTFDSDVEIVSADDDDELDPHTLKEQVRRAIERHKYGEDESFDRVRAVFNTPVAEQEASTSKAIKAHLQAIVANVAILSKGCSSLVNDVLQSEWIGRDDSYYSLYVRFLTNLAAAQRGYQNQIMQMLVNLLGPQKTRRLRDSKPMGQKKIHKRVLSAIQHVSVNVPSTLSSLVDGVATKLDFEFENADERMTYIRSFMNMNRYVPEITSEVITSILREVIKLDAHVQSQFDRIDDLMFEEELLHHMTLSSQTLTAPEGYNAGELAEDDDDSTLAGSETTEDDEVEPLDETPEEAQRRKLQENIRQVDQIMEILFSHHNKMITSANLNVRNNAVEQLITYFESYVLPSHRSRHPQFLLFHFCQNDTVFMDRFVTSCTAKLLDKRQLPYIRFSAAAYLSGFIGRGAHVGSQLIHDCLGLLCKQLDTLRQAYEPKAMGPDVKRFGDFYSTFQAAAYIFCLRWRDVALSRSDTEDDSYDFGYTQAEQYHFSDEVLDAFRNAIYSTLNPLRVCSPDIIKEFANLMSRLQLLFLHSLIEENKQVRVATHWRSLSDLSLNDPNRDMSWMGEDGMLEGWFPFDPYELPISKRWLEGDYIDWQEAQGEEKVLTDSEDDGNALISTDELREDDMDHF